MCKDKKYIRTKKYLSLAGTNIWNYVARGYFYCKMPTLNTFIRVLEDPQWRLQFSYKP